MSFSQVNNTQLPDQGSIEDVSQTKTTKTINITATCREKIAQLKAKNKELYPKKIKEGRLALIGLASLICMVAGIILTGIGIGLCFTGALPLGISLIGGGVGLVLISTPFFKFACKRFPPLGKIAKNKDQIKILIKIIKDQSFKQFASGIRNELSITHITTPDLALKYDLIRLHEFYQRAEEERLSKPRKKERNNFQFEEYSVLFNFLSEKISISHQLLKEMDHEIKNINNSLKRRNLDRVKSFELERKKEILKMRAKKMKIARADIIKSAPDIGKMSMEAFARYEHLQKVIAKPFPLLD